MLPLHQRRLFSSKISCGGRNRTCVRAGNNRLPIPTRAPPHQHQTTNGGVKVTGFEPVISCFQNTRVSQTSLHPEIEPLIGLLFFVSQSIGTMYHLLKSDHVFLYASEHPAGVEPALPPWQGSRLPLHHGAKYVYV